jgi:hypothetical protein
MNKLGQENGTCLCIVPCHAIETTNALVGKLAERRRREVEVVVCAPYAAVHYGACNALAFVCGNVYEHCRQTTYWRPLTMRSHFLATNRVIIRVGTIITAIRYHLEQGT